MSNGRLIVILYLTIHNYLTTFTRIITSIIKSKLFILNMNDILTFITKLREQI